MKLNKFFRLGIIVTLTTFLLGLFLKIFSETPYDKIERLKENFRRKNDAGEIDPVVVIPKSKDDVDPIISDTHGDFLYAAITFKGSSGKKLNVDLFNTLPSPKPPLHH